MKTRAIITGWTGTEFAKMAMYSLPLIEHYAKVHECLFACGNLCGPRPPSWLKVKLVEQALQQVDEVAWIDSDVIIEKFDVSIFSQLSEDAWQGLVEHDTASGIIPNCGIWVLRKPMLSILSEIWDSNQYIDHGWWEQAAILERMGYKVVGTTAVREKDSLLFSKTSFLGSEWNHHPCDNRQVLNPRFRHVTQYPDRVSAARYFAKKVESDLDEKFV